MTKILSLLLIILATLTTGIQAESSLPIYRTFIPAVLDRVNTTQVIPKRCMAWAYYPAGRDLNFYSPCFQGWTISDTQAVGGDLQLQNFACDCWGPGGYRDPTCPYNYLDQLGTIEDYTGILLFLNEPNATVSSQSSCAMTKQEAVIWYDKVREKCPLCQLTLPNVSHTDYLAGWVWIKGFLDHYKATHGGVKPDIAYGSYHTYLSEHPSLMLNSYRNLLTSYGYGVGVKLILSEVGSCDKAVAKTMVEYFEASTRVKHYLWYSPGGTGCTSLSENNFTTYTEVGCAYLEAAHLVPGEGCEDEEPPIPPYP